MSDLIALPGLENRSKTLTLTPELATLIVSAITTGSSRYGAASLAGVRPATFFGWLESANKEPDSPFGALLAAILTAEATFEARNAKAAEAKARQTKDHLDLLAQHPSHRERWGARGEDIKVGVVVQIGFEPDKL